MNWKQHFNLKNTHALLGASQCAWLAYDEAKLIKTIKSDMAAERGTKLHDLAQQMISLGVDFAGETDNYKQYVNDAIGFRMQPEQVLWYSENIYGAADAIAFDGKMLRIHDLKTGSGKVHIEQLLIYAALFCLEYCVKPTDIDIELRLYHKDGIIIGNPTAEDVLPIMDKIIKFDKLIEQMKEEMK